MLVLEIGVLPLRMSHLRRLVFRGVMNAMLSYVFGVINDYVGGVSQTPSIDASKDWIPGVLLLITAGEYSGQFAVLENRGPVSSILSS